MKIVSWLSVTLLIAPVAAGAPVSYIVDPNHTYPSFEADHLGGLSTWRGKINETSGKIVLDRDAGTGIVDVTMKMTSIDFGLDDLNEHAKSPDIFDATKFPIASYKGSFANFKGKAPTEVNGNLTLRGVTRPVTLKINSVLCKPVRAVEVCGADASATINRVDFGVDFGVQMGFKPEVVLRIQVEAKRS